MDESTTTPPADGESEELAQWLDVQGDCCDGSGDENRAQRYWRAAALLRQLRPVQPVPVSERLPEAGDCNAEGRCWWLIAGCESWILSKQCFAHGTHWLPAHALPLPSEEVE